MLMLLWQLQWYACKMLKNGIEESVIVEKHSPHLSSHICPGRLDLVWVQRSCCVAGALRERRGSLSGVHLVVAGGYDDRVAENRDHYLELRTAAERLHLDAHVTFLRSFSDAQKRALLSRAACLLYTPDREHFGIVPVEAMYLRTPVLAVRSGGPLETVADGTTGFLLPQDAAEFAERMNRFVDDPALSKVMGEAGRERVEEKFSFETFTRQLDAVVTRLCAQWCTRLVRLFTPTHTTCASVHRDTHVFSTNWMCWTSKVLTLPRIISIKFN